MPSFRQIQRRTFDSDRDNLKITEDITGIGDGNKVVTTAATRVPLVASSTPAKEVDIQAKEGNTGVIVVGGSTVVALAGATRRGVALNPLASVHIKCDDLADIYLDATVSGEGVTFTYYT